MPVKTYTEPQAHTHFAKTLNNQVWALLGKENRTEQENDHMLHAAHGSAFHWQHAGTGWQHAGTGVNRQRADWLLAHVYTELEQTQLALSYAKKCLESSKQFSEELEEFDWAYANIGLARAQALAKQKEAVKSNLDCAANHITRIKNQEDKDLVLSDMKSFNWFGSEPHVINSLSSL